MPGRQHNVFVRVCLTAATHVAMAGAKHKAKSAKALDLKDSKQGDIASFFGPRGRDRESLPVGSSVSEQHCGKVVLPFTSKMRSRAQNAGAQICSDASFTSKAEPRSSNASSPPFTQADKAKDLSEEMKSLENVERDCDGECESSDEMGIEDGALSVNDQLGVSTTDVASKYISESDIMTSSTTQIDKRSWDTSEKPKARKRLRRLADSDSDDAGETCSAHDGIFEDSAVASRATGFNSIKMEAHDRRSGQNQVSDDAKSEIHADMSEHEELASNENVDDTEQCGNAAGSRTQDVAKDEIDAVNICRHDEVHTITKGEESEDDDAGNNVLESVNSTLSLDFSTKPSWSVGKPVPYKFVADTFAKVEAITGRLEIQAILTDAFRRIIATTPDDLLPVVYLCVNKLAPAHEGVEIGVGEGILLKALCQTTGTNISALRARYKEVGDLGDVASNARTTQKTMFPPPPLTARKVFAELRAIAQAAGKASQDTKKSKILKLLVASVTRNEVKYLARALQGKLRIHLADKTVIIALAAAFTLERLGVGTGMLLTVDGKKKTKLSAKEEEMEQTVKIASSRLSGIFNQLPVWDIVIPALLKCREVNDELAEKCEFLPGVPISPMLAKPTKAISEVLDRFAQSTFTCEYKYDGERAQVHRLSDGSVRIYSRNAENLTPKYPDLVSALPKSLKQDFKDASFVVDAEAVAYDIERKTILPFQELQGRKRKDVDESSVKVRVCVFAFDLLYFNDSSLLLETFSKRRELMMSSFDEIEGVFMFAKSHDSRDPDEILELLNNSVKAGCEGLMVKALDGPHSTYEPANRSQNWLKVKKDYLEGLGDTLDLVPIGGYLGRGRRTGTYGGFLLACYDPENEEYQSICKIGTGFSDADFEKLSAFYNDEAAGLRSDFPKAYYRLSRNKNIEPDVWFEPAQVWEIKCADLSISPAHTAGIGKVDNSKGIALRFPRFLRVRDDKNPDDATTAEQVAELYSLQSSIANQALNNQG